MRFGATVVFAFLIGMGIAFLVDDVDGFAPNPSFVGRHASAATQQLHKVARSCQPGCPCPGCQRPRLAERDCQDCVRCRGTRLYADATEEAEPAAEAEPTAEAEPVAEEAQAKESGEASAADASPVRRKRPTRGRPLRDFEVGSTVPGVVRTIASYGAFCSFGAVSDGLVHISRISKDYVRDVNMVLAVGDKVNVRIVDIDEEKNQVALSLLSVEEEQEVAAERENPKPQQRPRPERQQRSTRSSGNNAELLSQITEADFEGKFFPGKVVNTPNFGAFVRVDVSAINPELSGEFDGLVHISALQSTETAAVTDVVNVNDEVSVRILSINKDKVALSMISAEEEAFDNDDEWKILAAEFGTDDDELGNECTEWEYQSKKHAKKESARDAFLV